jgi:D-alanine-D-alanine ligase
MAAPLVLVLYNKPLLPKDHPDAESEYTVVDIAATVADILGKDGFGTELMGLGRDPALLWNTLRSKRPAVVFNLFEGSLDDTETETYVAGLLEWSGIPYTGSPPQALSLCRAKHTAKMVLRSGGVPTAPFMVVDQLPVPACKLKWPVIVKAARQDASVGLDQKSVCTEQKQLDQRVAYILETYGAPVLIEEFIEGREFNVAVVDMPELRYLPPAEILFEMKTGEWPILTYAGKWTPGSNAYEGTPPKYPADIPTRLARRLGEISLRAFRLLGCRDYARVDLRVNSAGKAYVLEMNPNPEISDEAGFARCLNSAGLSYPMFVTQLVRYALERGPTPLASLGLSKKPRARELAQ